MCNITTFIKNVFQYQIVSFNNVKKPQLCLHQPKSIVFFSYLLYSLELLALSCVRVMRACILTLFLILEGKHSVFPH